MRPSVAHAVGVGAVQSQLGGTPRHRVARAYTAADAAVFLGAAAEPQRDAAKRPRVNVHLMVMVVGLAAAALLSMAMFNAHSAEIAEWQHYQRQQYTSSPTPGRRHRKMESPGLEQAGQADGAGGAAEQQAGGAGAGGAAGGDDAEVEEGHGRGDEYEDADEEAAGGGDQPGRQAGAARRKKSPYHRALERCTSLDCVRQAARQKRHKGQFLFPHFLIIGWQKCATTSLFHHLKDHPAVLMPVEKEPEFFSYDCDFDPLGCPPDKQKEYLEQTLHLNRALRHNLHRAMFEGSTHYAREGHRPVPAANATFAHSLYQVFPWVKLIASVREPISRYLSMLGHNLDKNTYTCLNKHDSLFECLELELPWNNYTTPVAAWLDTFPREQLLLLQYESLVAPDQVATHLRTVKSFLGLDPELPANELPSSNTRADRLGRDPEGWPMQKWQYERLIEVVRPDVDRLARLVAENGLGDPAQWVGNWQRAWQENLDACDADGNCRIR